MIPAVFREKFQAAPPQTLLLFTDCLKLAREGTSFQISTKASIPFSQSQTLRLLQVHGWMNYMRQDTIVLTFAEGEFTGIAEDEIRFAMAHKFTDAYFGVLDDKMKERYPEIERNLIRQVRNWMWWTISGWNAGSSFYLQHVQVEVTVYQCNKSPCAKVKSKYTLATVQEYSFMNTASEHAGVRVECPVVYSEYVEKHAPPMVYAVKIREATTAVKAETADAA